MRITASQDDLNSALTIALRAISSRSILPVLSGVKLVAEPEIMRLSATDLEITLHSSLNIATEEPGSAVLPAKLLGEAIKNLPHSAVRLSVDPNEGEAIIECGKTRLNLKSLPLEDYPQLPQSGDEEFSKISSDVFSEAIRQVIKAVGRDESRPTLAGVYFVSTGKRLKLVATDSYRLAVKELEFSEDVASEFDIIIPSRAVEELGKMTGEPEVQMLAGENQVFFKAGNVELISRLIEGKFPKYQQLIPAEWKTRVTFSKDQMIAAVKRVSTVSPQSAVVRFLIEGNSIQLNAHTQDVGSAQDEIECVAEGESMEIAFSAQYLVDGLSVLKGDAVSLEMVSSIKAALLRSEIQSDYFYLIMPIRLN